MKIFKLIDREIDVDPFVRELSDHPYAWSLDTSRQESVSEHRETDTILIRGQSEQAILDRDARANMAIRYVGRPTSFSPLFPRTSDFVDQLAKKMSGVLGRAVIVRLKPYGQVYQHTDSGLYYELRSRYHLVLKSVAGSRLRSGDEEVRMREGDLWWFENRIPHEAFNDSEEDRIHLIVDVLSPRSILSFFFRSLR